jgi:hypothetical protein
VVVEHCYAGLPRCGWHLVCIGSGLACAVPASAMRRIGICSNARGRALVKAAV